MIKADDVGLITRVYRLQKLLRPTQEAAAASTCKLVAFATEDQILEIIAAEEKRRADLMQILKATQKELLG